MPRTIYPCLVKLHIVPQQVEYGNYNLQEQVVANRKDTMLKQVKLCFHSDILVFNSVNIRHCSVELDLWDMPSVLGETHAYYKFKKTIL